MPNVPKKIRNWKECNKAFVKRGQLLLSFDADYLDQLYYHCAQRRGGQVIYSPHMYEFLLNIKVLLRLPWRAATGFALSLLQKAFPSFAVQVPNYSHASRAWRIHCLNEITLVTSAWAFA